MEKYKLTDDITLSFAKAKSFPDGILDAHQALINLIPSGEVHNYFGVSYLQDDGILYMASVQINGHAGKKNDETFTLRKGNYISIYLADFHKDLSLVDNAFKKLLDNPGIDPNGCCVECYLPEGSTALNARDVRCMIRLAD